MPARRIAPIALLVKKAARKGRSLVLMKSVGHEKGAVMSEFINNHSQRKDKLKEALRQIHAGKPYEEVKVVFAEDPARCQRGRDCRD